MNDLMLSLMAMSFVDTCRKMRKDLIWMTSDTAITTMKPATDEERIEKSKELYKDVIKHIFTDVPDNVFADIYKKAKNDLEDRKEKKAEDKKESIEKILEDILKDMVKGV